MLGFLGPIFLAGIQSDKVNDTHWTLLCVSMGMLVLLLQGPFKTSNGVSFASAMFERAEHADHPEGDDRCSPTVSRLMHLLIIDILTTCVALHIGSALQLALQQIKNNLRAKRHT